MPLKNTVRQFGCVALLALLACGNLRAGVLFHPVQAYPSGGLTAHSIAVGDVNGDGKPDMVMANVCIGPNNCHGGVGVLLANGDGGFQPVKVFELPFAFADAVGVADVNRDGKLDVVVTNGGSCPPASCGLVAVLLGNGDGSLAAAQNYFLGGFTARDVRVADVNGDGNLDLLVANPGADYYSRSMVAVLLGNGDGTFQAAQTFDSGSNYLLSLAVGDVNGDGKLDVLTLHEGYWNLVGVLLGNGDGTFQAPQTYSPGGASIAVADVNEDDKLDLLVAGNVADFNKAAASVLLGNGDGTFQAAQNYATNVSNVTAIATADVNGDDQVDLLLAHSSCGSCNGVVIVLPGNGDGTFMAPLRYTSGGGKANAIAVADVNGDGKADALVANGCLSYTDCSSGTAGVLLGWAVKTNTTLASSLNPSIYGQKITWTATVTTFGSVPATGKVIFRWSRDGQTHDIGVAPLDASGVATLTRSNLNVPFGGPYPIVASYYLSDPMNLPSTSGVVLQSVLQTKTAAAITSSLNPSAHGQPVTFTARITSPTVTPTGPVTFAAGSTVLGTAQLSGGKAMFTISTLPVGSTWFKVTYYGNSNITTSSAAVRQTVQ